MKKWLLCLAVAAAVTACATTTSSTGRKQYVGGVSQAQLDQLGAQAFTEAKQKGPLSTDARQNAYVRCVVDALVRQLPPEQRQVAWETAVFSQDEPNAFALPGGKVGVNSGILGVARNQDQLAAVLAHEIGHVVERHHDERITRQQGAGTLLGLGSAILGSLYGQGAADATTQLGGAAAQGFVLLPNNRQQESEADIVGQRLMARAGFDPRQAVNLWENMIQASSGSRAPQWLSTHPDPANRIRELQRDLPALLPVYEAARQAGNTPRCG
ncbi:M48 family metallopeptidase [Pseudoxanthomonas mexicana]|uniref:M48 family metallopeptidase n=1 Tax=Pseudoxanthomonas mexicana TaxID=128785 RepID=UPI00398A5F94